MNESNREDMMVVIVEVMVVVEVMVYGWGKGEDDIEAGSPWVPGERGRGRISCDPERKKRGNL